MQACHSATQGEGGGRGPLALALGFHHSSPSAHHPSFIVHPRLLSILPSNAQPTSPTPSPFGRTAQTTGTAAGCVYLLGTSETWDRRLHATAVKDGSQPCRCFDGPRLVDIVLCVCHGGVASVHLSVSKERHVCGCVCLCMFVCVCMYDVCMHSSHHMAPPPSRVASSSTCNSKKHKVPPDQAGPNALLDSDCTARVQSNLSDDVVMGSPPHPWAPDSGRKGKYFASRPPLCLCPCPCQCLSLSRCASMSSCQGRQETLQQHVPEPCASKGTPHGLY